MITGAHAILYSKDDDADRAFLRDVLGFPFVDAGGGWLIFRLPPAEVAIHPSDESSGHELYLMTDDVEGLVASLRARGLETSPISEQRWGRLTHVTLPGGGRLGVYEPRHKSPPLAAPRAKGRSRARPKKATAAGRKRSRPSRPARRRSR
jgi:hypothetical protein